MLSVISPAKTLDFENNRELEINSVPELLDQSEKLMTTLKKKSVNKLMTLQGISKNLAELNCERNARWSIDHDKTQTGNAISVFQGDVYVGLGAADFDSSDDDFAAKHLRILSGLYGILKPTDRIMPYRLEMGTKLRTTRGKDIYAFWKNRVTEVVNKEINKHENRCLINLASDEYFNVLKAKNIEAEIVQPVFMDKKNGKYKVISFFAKKARGLMARYIVKNEIDEIEAIKGFNSEGYLFNSAMSSGLKWVFTRNQE